LKRKRLKPPGARKNRRTLHLTAAAFCFGCLNLATFVPDFYQKIMVLRPFYDLQLGIVKAVN
jgi:hypothetical protein